jgi:DNA-binding response OmpR family regulator
VLVVDDEFGVRSGIKQILRDWKATVDDAGTGREALACSIPTPTTVACSTTACRYRRAYDPADP